MSAISKSKVANMERVILLPIWALPQRSPTTAVMAVKELTDYLENGN